MTRQDRYRGALLGLAAGDALGTTLEFQQPGSFAPLTDIIGGGPFDLKAGQWTDDTSMALCLAESLIECRGFDALDQMRRYVRWYREGHHSSTGRCFDIGSTVRDALLRFERSGDPWCGSTDARTAGNGSLMRLAPVVLCFADDPACALARAADSSRTTHGAREAVDACRFFAALIVGAIQGRSREALLTPGFTPLEDGWSHDPLAPAVAEIANGGYLSKEPPAIEGSGYVVRSLEAALWALANTDSFEEGALRAVNLGDDADTTGAIYGQLAGALYGVEAIPASWRARLAQRDLLERYADALVPGTTDITRA